MASLKIVDTAGGSTFPNIGTYGVWGDSNGGEGVLGTSEGGNGVFAQSRYGQAIQAIGGTNGIFGMAQGGWAGVSGHSPDGDGIAGVGETGNGVSGSSTSGFGIVGWSDNADAVVGLKGNDNGAAGTFMNVELGGTKYILFKLHQAGSFFGHVDVLGNLTASAKSFKIDHPLDPANKLLYHCTVESPDMKNIYDGVATLDATGSALVRLPAWFGALNKDLCYQLTPIGSPAPNLHIAKRVTDNRFRIAGGRPGMKVSWQVTGIRRDAWANAHRMPVEVRKSKAERGHYLHPEVRGELKGRRLASVLSPELMRRVSRAKQVRETQLRRRESADAEITKMKRQARTAVKGRKTTGRARKRTAI